MSQGITDSDSSFICFNSMPYILKCKRNQRVSIINILEKIYAIHPKNVKETKQIFNNLKNQIIIMNTVRRVNMQLLYFCTYALYVTSIKFLWHKVDKSMRQTWQSFVFIKKHAKLLFFVIKNHARPFDSLNSFSFHAFFSTLWHHINRLLYLHSKQSQLSASLLPLL